LEEIQLVDHMKKIRAFLDEQKKHNPVIVKLRTNKPLTAVDLAELDKLLFEASGFENRKEFERYFGEHPHLGEWVRSIVGMDREAAKAAFGEFLSGTKYTSAQIDFINGVVDFLTQRGTIEIGQLYQSPLTTHPDGVDAIFPNDANAILDIVRSIRANARVM
jgi:type I restriction enzyme R subunit